MALLKTIQEIRAVVPRLSNLSNTANMPNMDKAGYLHIVPIIGDELYEALEAKYNSGNPLTEDEEKLLKRIQVPLAASALYDDLPFLQTNITDNGIRTAETDTLKAAHRWEYMGLKDALAELAAQGIELLLTYLYKEKDQWEQWANSEAFKQIDTLLIKSGSDFKKYYNLVQPLRTYWALRPVLVEVEENYLAPMLGRDLLKWVKTQDSILIQVDGGEVDVLKVLKKATASFAIKHAPEQLAVQFSTNGFTVLASRGSLDDPNTDGKVAAGSTDIKVQVEAANREGQNNLAKAASYLVRIAAGQFDTDFGADFTNAFEHSPLKPDPGKQPYTNGNERRKIFRF